MKKGSEYFKFATLAFCIGVVFYFSSSFVPPRVSSAINDISYWYTYTVSEKRLRDLRIVGVAVDEYSLNNIPERWPWKRSLYAELIKTLDKEQVKAIGIDFAFVGSEDRLDDLVLEDAFKNASSPVVLAYIFDLNKRDAVLPSLDLKEGRPLLGMVNTPMDSDGLTRRLRAYIEFKGRKHYSLSVMLAAAFLDQGPDSLISAMPLLKDKTYQINYLLQPKDIAVVSFYDILNGMDKLKKQYGADFLKGALTVVYPQAGIFHDVQRTPLGEMPGGFLHLNGASQIISRRFIRDADALTALFLVLSLGAVFYILKSCGFMTGFLFALGVCFLNFWSCVLLRLTSGTGFDYARPVLAGIVFFILGSLYEYGRFLAQILKIKDKATLDPLRGLFNLRHFYYRLDIELKKIYFNREPFLLFIRLEGIKDALEDLSFEKVGRIWKDIDSALASRGSLWAVYSPEEIAGCIFSSEKRQAALSGLLRNSLAAALKEQDINIKIRIASVRLKKDCSYQELLFILSEKLKGTDLELISLKDKDLEDLRCSVIKAGAKNEFLDTLGEDIEDKNRQLLSLIDELRKEHAKTKEAFFEIIASLAKALEARDPYTEGHSQRVCNYALKMAERLGWPKDEREKLKKAALLHDLGKIGIPDNVLHKKGPLNDDEYTLIKRHEIIAVEILKPLKEIGDILPWILYHHERWDGKGYPHGLAGDAIPVASQIIAICDVFDALTTGRDYKVAFALEDSLGEMVKEKGARFNPKLVDVFVEMIKKG